MINEYTKDGVKVRDMLWCTKCKTDEDLMVITTRKNVDGSVSIYHYCKPCNNEKRKKYYYNGNQEKIMIRNRRYLKTK